MIDKLCISLAPPTTTLTSPLTLSPPCLQVNVTDLDWTQLSKKECLTYGGALQGSSCQFVPDLALMSFILFFGTYTMTVSLKKFKFSRYFPTKVCRNTPPGTVSSNQETLTAVTRLSPEVAL